MNHQDAVIVSAIVELGANIWMFGGHGSSWPAANVYYLRTNEDGQGALGIALGILYNLVYMRVGIQTNDLVFRVGTWYSHQQLGI